MIEVDSGRRLRSWLTVWHPEAQVTATNAALSDVHNLLTFWAGLSMVDRRTRNTKFHIVSTIERCCLVAQT